MVEIEVSETPEIRGLIGPGVGVQEQDGILGGKCKILHLCLKHQQHKARHGKYGKNTDVGETQSKRIGVIKDLLYKSTFA